MSPEFISWAPDRSRLTHPLYLSLAQQLESDIVSGRLSAGTRLPPQRELADYLGINFTTVTRAYGLCRERQLLYGVTGRGSFVAPRPGPPEVSEGRSLLECGIVNGFDSIRRPVIEATGKVLEKGYLEQLYSYAEPAGHLHQRAAGVRWMSQLGVRTDMAHTAIFSGAQNVISAALLSLFRLGDRLATDAFTYANLIGTARLAHITLVPIPGDASGMLPDELDRACRSQAIAGIFLMPSCANPTTITLSEERKRALADVIRTHDLILIEDDHDGALRPDHSAPLHAALPANTVYICGSTMSLCSGLRVTFAAFPERCRERLLDGLFHLSIKTSSLDAEIMTELILSGGASQILREKRRLASKANAIFDSVFPELAGPSLAHAFFRRLPLPDTRLDANQVERRLHEAGVSAYHSQRFAVLKQNGPQFLRVSVSSTDGDASLRQALEAIRKVRQTLADEPH